MQKINSRGIVPVALMAVSMIFLSACGSVTTQDTVEKPNNTENVISEQQEVPQNTADTDPETEKNVSDSVTTEKDNLSENETTTEPTATSYVFRCTDENGGPVEGVSLQICTDEACFLVKTGADGVAEYAEEPLEYDVHVYKYGDVYDLVSDAEFTTDKEYGEYNIEFKTK